MLLADDNYISIGVAHLEHRVFKVSSTPLANASVCVGQDFVQSDNLYLLGD